MNEIKADYIQNLINDYGHMCGIKSYEIKPNQFKYRLRERSNSIGTFISEKRTIQILNKTKQRVQLKKLQKLEDAFGPDELLNLHDLNIQLY